MNPSSIFLVNLVATWYLVGLIWMVQIVHYKLLDRVGETEFVRYEQDHCRLITPIVAPPMLVELAASALLLYCAPPGLPRWVVLVGLFAVIAVWLSTFFLQVPCHNQLSKGFDLQSYERLVASNWIRTLLWSAKGILLAVYTSRIFASS